MKRIFVPTQSGTDWQRLLGKPKLHWKKGRSAMAAAACWEESNPDLPAEVRAVLGAANDPDIADLELLVAIPEWQVDLPGGERASQTDVLALTRNPRGFVVLGVEAKVDEPFGPSLAEKRAEASAGQLERITYLEAVLGRAKPFPDPIRYQLLHRSASALLTAKAFHASVAVMLIQSFSPMSAWRDDFSAFCGELRCHPLSPDLFEAPGIDGVRLILGWCKGDEKYLEVELPGAI
jgi:hypothetical protein